MKTVRELIAVLENFPPEMPVVYRKAGREGGFIDYELHQPQELYPGGAVVLQSFQPIDLGSPQSSQ